MENNGKPLRFAPLVRISCEQSGRQGESLKTQTTRIVSAVERLGGTLIPDPWRYSGQEHATSEYEKKRFDQLLKDCSKDLFDAIIVDDPSRWSRDNVKSGQGLEILKKNKIRFFASEMEFSLFDPTQENFINQMTVNNQYFARIQAYKSITNRIHRAKRGIPTSGKLPFGRTFDREKGWGIDETKREIIRQAAARYLNGEGLPVIAQSYGMNSPNLWKTLNHRSGTEWIQEFKAPRFGIEETVTITIPPLLEPEIIEAIRRRAEGNKTYTHGIRKHPYLLARMVVCEHCGYAMFGQTNKNGKRYYRHDHHPERRITCDRSFWVNADSLEEAVFLKLFAMVGDPVGLETAMMKAVPDSEKVADLLKQKESFERELAKTGNRKNRLIDSIADGIISKEEATVKIGQIREAETTLKNEIETINRQTQGLPTPEKIRSKASLIQRMVRDIFSNPARLDGMTFDEKRRIAQTVFDGKDDKGQRLGVYCRKVGKSVTYTIRGIFNTGIRLIPAPWADLDDFSTGEIPMADLEKDFLKKSDSSDTVKDSLSKRHAHHRVGVHQRRRGRAAPRL